MAGPERRPPAPTFNVEVSRMGVELEVYNDKPIPQADLIQAMINAGACTAYGLHPSWNSEGGVEGIYRKAPIQFENLSDGKVGIINMMWQSMDYLKDRQAQATNDVLGYYEVFLEQFVGRPINIEGTYYPFETFLVNPTLQTREAVWDRIMDTFAHTGGGKFPRQVRDWLMKTGEASRRYLRGLTDEEIQRFFVPPPEN